MPPQAHDAPPTTRDVADYRSVVTELTAALGSLRLGDFGRTATHDATAGMLLDYLSAPEAGAVVARAAGDSEALAARALDALESYRPTAAATAECAESMVRILLLQQIDLAWWAEVPDFVDDADMRATPGLMDLRELRARDEIDFAFSLASDGLVYRARNYAVRRWYPSARPGTPGPSSPLVRPQIVALLNRLAGAFAVIAGRDAPALWVNSISRPLDHQLQLQRLGFSAHIPSAHCRGWAADIETEWYDMYGVRDRLEAMLAEYSDAGVINAIDEGRIFHVCPSPDYARGLFALH